MNPRLFTFIVGNTRPWTVLHFKTVTGAPIPEPKRLEIVNGPVATLPVGAQWSLKGVTSNVCGTLSGTRRRNSIANSLRWVDQKPRTAHFIVDHFSFRSLT